MNSGCKSYCRSTAQGVTHKRPRATESDPLRGRKKKSRLAPNIAMIMAIQDTQTPKVMASTQEGVFQMGEIMAQAPETTS